jgi:hypothetical protein
MLWLDFYSPERNITMRNACLLTLGLAVAMICLSGCGGSDETTAPPTPTLKDLLKQLNKASQLNDTDMLVQLLSEDAVAQTGQDWLQFLERTGSAETLRARNQIPPQDLAALKDKPTAEFMKALRELEVKAKLENKITARMFTFILDHEQGLVEEDGLALAAMSSDGEKHFRIAMARTSGGSLRLLGEKATQEAEAKLGDKLAQAMKPQAEAK